MTKSDSTQRYTRSAALFETASKSIVGGVNSPARALRGVGGAPFFASHGKGASIFDVDGNEYVDYVLSFGPMIVGHAHPQVVARVRELAEKSLSFAAPTALETEMAELICDALPTVDLARMVNSGTEATMSALRAARGYTGRELILKFSGCYHGHADFLLVKAGSALATFGTPDSAGVPKETARNTLTAPYNDVAAIEALFAARGGDLAAVILEPVTGNMGVIAPEAAFLKALRRLCTEHGTVLIFDEVMTGFRLSWQGAQGLFTTEPDMVCLGKVIGGGMPVGAYAGRREIMSVVSPLGAVYQAGTLSGNPISVGAGLATLELLRDGTGYAAINQYAAELSAGLRSIAAEAGIPIVVNQVGSMFTLFFHEGPLRNVDDVDQCDKERFSAYFHGMRDRGVSLPPSQYEACFVSTAHGPRELARTLDAARATFAELR